MDFINYFSSDSFVEEIMNFLCSLMIGFEVRLFFKNIFKIHQGYCQTYKEVYIGSKKLKMDKKKIRGQFLVLSRVPHLLPLSST